MTNRFFLFTFLLFTFVAQAQMHFSASGLYTAPLKHFSKDQFSEGWGGKLGLGYILKEENKIGEKETAFHLSTVIDLKTAIVDYFEESNLSLSWRNTSEEDQNGICSVLLMDFLIELSLTLHKKFKAGR